MGQVASRFSGLFIRPAANLRPNDDEDPEQQLTFANAAGKLVLCINIGAEARWFIVLFSCWIV